MLQCSVGKEFLRLKDNDVQQRQKLEAANHRITELESQQARKDQLILSQKKLLEDTKNQNRSVRLHLLELSTREASDSDCVCRFQGRAVGVGEPLCRSEESYSGAADRDASAVRSDRGRRGSPKRRAAGRQQVNRAIVRGLLDPTETSKMI